MIPKIIHQIWLQGQVNIPKPYISNITKIKQLNSKWKYILWDEITILELIKTNKKWLEAYYKFAYMHNKIDFAKYVILYMFGGIYIDIDAYTIRPLDELLSEFIGYDLIVSTINASVAESYLACYRSKCINNGVIISSKDNYVILDLINKITDKPTCDWYDVKVSCIGKVAGPTSFTDTVMKYTHDSRIKILPYEYLEPCITTLCNITKNTYIVHMHSGTWYSDTLKQVYMFYIYNRGFLTFIILSIILLFTFWIIMKYI